MNLQTLAMPRLAYSLAEAESLCGLSRATLYRRIKAGELVAVKNGGRTLIPAANLAAFLKLDTSSASLQSSL